MPENENTDQGQLIVEVISAIGLIPVQNAVVRISYTTEPEDILEELEVRQWTENALPEQ